MQSDNKFRSQLNFNYQHDDRCMKQYINSSMQFITNQTELLTPHLNPSYTIKRHIRIKGSKLPPDFFIVPHSPRYLQNSIISREIGLDMSHRQLGTPSFHSRRRDTSLTKRIIHEQRKAQTARYSYQKINDEDQLIPVVLCTPSRLRNVLRNQSLEMKEGYSVDLEDRYVRLPKLLNKITHRV